MRGFKAATEIKSLLSSSFVCCEREGLEEERIMEKRLSFCCGAVAAGLLVTSQAARASLDSEPFADSSYVVGNALSAANWSGSTTGALTIATGPTSPNQSEGEAAAKAVRLDGGGTSVTGTYNGW